MFKEVYSPKRELTVDDMDRLPLSKKEEEELQAQLDSKGIKLPGAWPFLKYQEKQWFYYLVTTGQLESDYIGKKGYEIFWDWKPPKIKI